MDRIAQLAIAFLRSTEKVDVDRFPVFVQTGLCDRYGLRLQLVDEPIAHLSSRAKKADAFFKTSTSLRS
jgi:hypothetical protein